MPVVERIYRQNGLVYVSLEGLLGNRCVKKKFALPLCLEHSAQYLLGWMLRESLYGGMAKVMNMSPQIVERILEKGSGGKVRLKIASHGTATVWLSHLGRIRWYVKWLAYKARAAFAEPF